MEVKVGDNLLFLREADAATVERLDSVNLSSWEMGLVVRITPSLVVETDDGSEFIVKGSTQALTKVLNTAPIGLRTDLTHHVASSQDSFLERQALFILAKRFGSAACDNATFVGPSMLVVFNPFQRLHRLTEQPSPKSIGQKVRTKIGVQPIVNVIVTGLSGSGKTESAKQLVEEIVQGSSGCNTGIEELMSAWNPLMECFGNAPTPMNNNSSRFAKVLTMSLQKSSTGALTLRKAAVRSFMLELTRVTFAASVPPTDPSLPMMRPFHIFGMLFQPHIGRVTKYQQILHPEKRKQWGLTDTSLFRAFPVSLPKVPPPFGMSDVVDALAKIGMDDDTIENIFRVLAGILHLLNVDFTAEDAFSPSSVTVESVNSLKMASMLLFTSTTEVSQELQREMERLLTTVSLGEVQRQLNKSAAAALRDSIARFLYSSLVQWVFGRLSFEDNSGSNEGQVTEVNIVDFFGFESVAHQSRHSLATKGTDGFEQLLINHSNDVLQSYFEENMFLSFATEVEQEAVGESLRRSGFTIPLCKSKRSVDALTRKQGGLFSILADSSALGQQTGSNESSGAALVSRIVDSCDAQNKLAIEKKQAEQDCQPIIKRERTNPATIFVEHFCDIVRYSTTDDWIKKNRLLNRGLTGAIGNALQLAEKKNTVISSLLTVDSIASPQGQSFVAIYQAQLEAALAPLLEGGDSTFWIRCIKPNQENVPRLFDGEYVSKQLSCSGIYRTLQLLTEGFMVRLSHFDFVTRFLRPLFDSADLSAQSKSDFPLFLTPPAKMQFQRLLNEGKYRDCCVWAAKTVFPSERKVPLLIIGLSLVFLKQSTFLSLQDLMNAALSQSSRLLQRVGRSYASRLAMAVRRAERGRLLFVAEAAKRVERERPLREALERERHLLHSALRLDAQHQLTSLHRRSTRTSKILQCCATSTSTLRDALVLGLSSITQADELRLTVEHSAKAKDEHERAAEVQRHQAVLEERRRAAAQRLAMQQAKAQRDVNISKRPQFDEKTMISQISTQQQTVLRAKADIEAAQLRRWETSYESQSLAAARRKIRDQRSPFVHADPRGTSTVSRSRPMKEEGSTFQIQRDIWTLWEQY